MNYAKGAVKTECFYWNSEVSQFYSMGKENKGCSFALNSFLKDVAYVNSEMIQGANILILFYIK